MTIGEAVRQRIFQLCEQRNLSVNKLCTLSGVTQSTMNNNINGRNNSMTVSTLKKLCDGMGISIQEFFNSEIFSFILELFLLLLNKTTKTIINNSNKIKPPIIKYM